MSLILAILFASTCQVQAPKKTCIQCTTITNQIKFTKIENNGTYTYKKIPTMWIKLPKKTKNSN